MIMIVASAYTVGLCLCFNNVCLMMMMMCAWQRREKGAADLLF